MNKTPLSVLVSVKQLKLCLWAFVLKHPAADPLAALLHQVV